MKKYSSTKKGNYRQVSLIRYLVLLVIAVFVLVLSLLFLPRLLSGAVGLFWMPFDSVRVWVTQSGSSLPMYLRDRSVLVDELEKLRIKDAMSQASENTISILEAENADFRKLLDAVPQERLLARVIARPNQLPYDVLLVDQGFADGVVLNAPIFLGKNQVIGYVSKVHAKTSLVTLVTTPGFSATAFIIGPNIYTYTEGMGGGITRVTVPQGIALAKDDLVILPALDSGVYGKIEEISTSPTQPEQYGYLSIGVSLQSLKYVTIGREAITKNSFTDADKLVKAITSDLFLVTVPDELLISSSTASSSPGISSTEATSSSPQ